MARKTYTGFQNGTTIKNTEVVHWTIPEVGTVDVFLSNSIKVTLKDEDAQFFLEKFDSVDYQDKPSKEEELGHATN